MYDCVTPLPSAISTRPQPPPAHWTWVEPLLRSASSPTLLTALSHRATLCSSGSTAVTTASTHIASCVTARTRRWRWCWLARYRSVDLSLPLFLPLAEAADKLSVSSQVRQHWTTPAWTEATSTPRTTATSTTAPAFPPWNLRHFLLTSRTKGQGTSSSVRNGSRASSTPAAATTASAPSMGSTSHFCRGSSGWEEALCGLHVIDDAPCDCTRPSIKA